MSLFTIVYNCCGCCLVPKSYATLCGPTDCRMPGFPVLHYLPEFNSFPLSGWCNYYYCLIIAKGDKWESAKVRGAEWNGGQGCIKCEASCFSGMCADCHQPRLLPTQGAQQISIFGVYTCVSLCKLGQLSHCHEAELNLQPLEDKLMVTWPKALIL